MWIIIYFTTIIGKLVPIPILQLKHCKAKGGWTHLANPAHPLFMKPTLANLQRTFFS